MVEARENGNSNTEIPGTEIRVHVFGRTDVGMVREHNEDSFLVADLSRSNRSIQPEVKNHVIGKLGSVFAVCDGMGGAAAGEVASKLGVDTIYEILQASEPPEDDDELAIRLNEAICEAGKKIYAESKANSARRGMGTTATVALLTGERLLFGQVGDSRAHIIRKGKLVQTTKDQSLVQQLIDANQLTVEEAKNFDRSNIILQALGTSEEVHVDVTSTLLRRGDILVICSDGLSGMVEPEDIRDVVLAIEDPADACMKLTQMACDNGGDDNVTVIIAHFDGDGLSEPGIGDEVVYEKYMLPGLDDDDSITLPRGMPAVPGSSARSGVGARTKEEQARGKLPFLILLAILMLVGMVFVFTWNGEHSGASLSDSSTTVSLSDAQAPTDTVSGKSAFAEDETDSSDIGNAVLLDQETDMDFVRGTDTDSSSDTGTDSESIFPDSEPDTESDTEYGTEVAVEDTSLDVDDHTLASDSQGDGAPGVPDPVFAGGVASDDQIKSSEGNSASQTKKVKVADRNAGKWARGKGKRKRKSEQKTETEDTEDSDTSEKVAVKDSEDEGEAAIESAESSKNVETDAKPGGADTSSSSEKGSEKDSENDPAGNEKQNSDSPEPDTASAPLATEENPY